MKKNSKVCIILGLVMTKITVEFLLCKFDLIENKHFPYFV